MAAVCELTQKVSIQSLLLCAAPGTATSFSHLFFCSRLSLLLYYYRPKGTSDPQLWLCCGDLLSPRSLVNLVIL